MLVKNANNLPLSIFSCSSPVPLRASLHSKRRGARAPPRYMVPAPLCGCAVKTRRGREDAAEFLPRCM